MIIASVVSLIYALIEASQHSFDFSPKGVKNFFNIFLQYKEVFAGTFLVLAAYFAINQLVVSKESHRQTQKAMHKSTWFPTLKEAIDDIKKDNLYIYKNILLNSNKIYDYVADRNYEFNSRKDLEGFFTEFLNAAIPLYEIYDVNYSDYEGVYPNERYSHSRNRIMIVIATIASPSKTYNNFLNDYNELYENVILNGNFKRKVDEQLFNLKQNEALNRKP